MPQLSPITIPQFGHAEMPPIVSTRLYEQRLRQLVQRMELTNLDVLAVYGDREHFANLCYLTGFDPRFEEALLLLNRDGRRKLLVGNECMGYLPDPSLDIETELFQSFSLLGQPRSQSRPLRTIFQDFGITSGCRVGAVGWKYDDIASTLDIPSYLADLLRDLAGAREAVRNETALLMGTKDGLRIINEPEQIACFEYAATVTSDGVGDLLEKIEPGVREDKIERFLDSRGLPLSCHRMVGFGGKAQRGLASASAHRAALGDPFTVAFGVNGGLTCRAGCVAHGAHELRNDLRDFFPRFAANYFEVVTVWYRTLRIGVTGGELFEAVEAARDHELYDFAVNPGHYIHLDEWVNAPCAPGDDTELCSGMALQCDIIPVSKGPFCYANMEDGVVLADAALRATLAADFPDLWGRMEARRTFMADKIGIRLDESVLPLGNLPACLAPYILAPDLLFTATS